jgi:1-acyl-sn-glycerol-3-phosphate acyltransferase
MFKHVFPRCDPSLHHQTELTPVNDETYRKGWVPPCSTRLHRAIQIVFFIVFFGWLRGLLLLLFTLIYIVILSPLVIFFGFEPLRAFWIPICEEIAKIYIPLVAMCLGVFRIRSHQKPHPDARVIVYNHVCLLDGPIVYCFSQFTIALTAGVQKIPFFGKVVTSSLAIFIDRRKSEGNSLLLKNAVLNKEIFPLAVAPEAKISTGDFLFRFRTGGFHTDEMIQPVTIRYTHFLPWANITMNAVVRSVWEWFFLSLCVPFGYCDVTYLEPIPKEALTGKTPEQRADMAQLALANALGTLASARTSHEIFGMEKKKRE